MNIDACLNIFKTKGRPLTDPLIVHVNEMEAAMPLIDQSDARIMSIFTTLGKHYWPGPLTLCLKANMDIIPSVITADTGYVGVRIP